MATTTTGLIYLFA